MRDGLINNENIIDYKPKTIMKGSFQGTFNINENTEFKKSNISINSKKVQSLTAGDLKDNK
jgi:hypothetical protein